MTRPGGLLLAGGRGARMGCDKARLEWAGETLLEYGVRRLGELVAPIWVSRNEPEPPLPEGVRRVADRYAGVGPLAGIEAGLAASGRPLLVLACDLPFVDSGILRRVLLAWEDSEDGVVVARGPRGREPLCGVYGVAEGPAARAYLESGGRSVLGFLSGRCVLDVEIPPAESDRAFRNLNRPGDVESAREMHRRTKKD